MAQRKYRTARGMSVDFNQLYINNELTPAIGNMNVNARGDEIAPDGTIIKSRDEIMKEYHNLNTHVVSNEDPPEEPFGTKALADEDPYADEDWDDPIPAATEIIAEPDPAPASSGTNIARMVESSGTSDGTSAPSGELAASTLSAETKTVTETVDKTGFEETEGVKRI